MLEHARHLTRGHARSGQRWQLARAEKADSQRFDAVLDGRPANEFTTHEELVAVLKFRRMIVLGFVVHGEQLGRAHSVARLLEDLTFGDL